MSNTFEDKIINCADCGDPFEFPAGEQEFYAKKEYQDPKRCVSCRNKRKFAQDNEN